jgi:hypothetical protein
MSKYYPKNRIEIPAHIVCAMMDGHWNDQCDIKIGQIVIKQNSEPDDYHKDGTEGVVIGNITHPDAGTVYYVRFNKDIPMGVSERRIRKKI